MSILTKHPLNFPIINSPQLTNYNLWINIPKGASFNDCNYEIKTNCFWIKSAQASLEGFALDTDNQQAKQLFQTAAQQTQTIIDSLNPRVEEVKQEEPQYSQQ